ncbi:HAD family hydrolase [Paracoccus aurantiacus]|nr:HAD family phosphatase [Paracoccus aurantiacus]
MKAIVFDIGNVLIRWDPVPPFIPALGTETAVRDFLDRIDFDGRNLRADAGASFADLAAELDDASDRRTLGLYLKNFASSLVEPIEGSWALMSRLRDRGLQIHAITNWSAETWPIGVRAHPRLGDAFGTVIVSGEEKLLKPDPEIFRVFFTRSGLDPRDCLFIDDKPENCAAAESVGMQSVHFTDPEALEAALQRQGLL